MLHERQNSVHRAKDNEDTQHYLQRLKQRFFLESAAYRLHLCELQFIYIHISTITTEREYCVPSNMLLFAWIIESLILYKDFISLRVSMCFFLETGDQFHHSRFITSFIATSGY